MSTIEHVLPVEARSALPWPRYLLDSVLAFGGVMLVTGDSLPLPALPAHSQHFDGVLVPFQTTNDAKQNYLAVMKGSSYER